MASINAPPSPWEQHNIVSLIHRYQSIMPQERSDEWNGFSERVPAAARTIQLILWSLHRKCEQKMAAAAFYPVDPDEPRTTRLRDGSSVFNAELEGLHLALKKFLTLYKSRKNFIVYTDSFSAVESLRGKSYRAKNVKRVYNLLKKLPPQVQVVMAWIPSHVGISGHERADGLAKAALPSSLTARSHMCWSDLKPKIVMYIDTIWQKLWNNEARNKLFETLPNLKESLCNRANTLYRNQESVMTRLRIGHTWITHSDLLKKEDQPFCHACDSPFTVKHFSTECPDLTHIRNKFYTTTDVHTLFREVDFSKITEYLKELGLYDKI